MNLTPIAALYSKQLSILSPEFPGGKRGYLYSYDPFGNIGTTEVGSQPFRYTGRRYDEDTELYYYRARYYSARLGRFLQTDPIGYEDNMNMYAYTGNDPVNGTDPTGKSFFSWLNRLQDKVVSAVNSATGYKGAAATFVDNNRPKDMPSASGPSGISPAGQESLKQAAASMAGSTPKGVAAILAGATGGTAIDAVASVTAAGEAATTAATTSEASAAASEGSGAARVSLRGIQATVDGKPIRLGPPENTISQVGITQRPVGPAVNPSNTTMGVVARGFKELMHALQELGDMIHH